MNVSETVLDDFLAQHADGSGDFSDLVREYGEPGAMTAYETNDNGAPSEKTKKAFGEIEAAYVVATHRGRRGSAWTIYEETEDSRITRKGRVYARNSLALYSYGDRTKILGWIVTPEGSGVFYKEYVIYDVKEIQKK